MFFDVFHGIIWNTLAELFFNTQYLLHEMNNFYESTGILKYTATDKLIVEVDQEISRYYYSLIPKYMQKQRPRWPAHITVVRAGKETPVNVEYWGKYEGKQINFFYDPIIKQGQVFYWLDVFCVELENIRCELGLYCDSIYAVPPQGFRKYFHMSIGNKKD